MSDVKHKGLYAALAAAQSEMGKALKDSVNPAFKSKYADLASVMAACMPALSKNGIAVLQPPYDDETGRYIKTIFVHGESGEMVECRVPLIIAKNDMQGYGSASTYARRYGLMGMAGIAPDDDDGNDAAKAAPKEDEAPAFNARAAADRVMKKLTRTTTIADLGEAWKSEAHVIGEIKAASQPIYLEVEAVKNKRKADLALADSADVGATEIPY